jgi:hypothetical protein
VEIAAGQGQPGRQIGDLAEMNRLFTAWVETVYHRRVHTETATAPLPRWMQGAAFPVPAPADLAEAFRWSEHRTVSKTALVSLHGNRYQVDPGLVGRKVELVFDPFDLTILRVRCEGADAATALPFQISRHAHPKAKPEVPAEPPTPTTGIDYLGLIDATHTSELADKVNYTALTDPDTTTSNAGGERATAMNTPTERVTITEIAQFTTWARRLSAAGPGATSDTELAAFHATKAHLFARIHDQHTHTTAPDTARPHPDSYQDTR